jgi:hypothetical protein
VRIERPPYGVSGDGFSVRQISPRYGSKLLGGPDLIIRRGSPDPSSPGPVGDCGGVWLSKAGGGAGGAGEASTDPVGAFGGFSVVTLDRFSGCADSPGSFGDSPPAVVGGTSQPSPVPAKARQKSESALNEVRGRSTDCLEE